MKIQNSYFLNLRKHHSIINKNYATSPMNMLKNDSVSFSSLKIPVYVVEQNKKRERFKAIKTQVKAIPEYTED